MGEYTIEEKLSAILNWAKENPDFDKKFVVAVQDYYDNHQHVSTRQSDAIDTIIAKWRIDVDSYF